MEIKLSNLIAPSFHDLHGELKNDSFDEYWLKGGRGSTKSTFVSIEILLGIIKDPDANAIVCRRYQNELRDTVFGQFEWTAVKMGISHLFKFQVSPMQIIYLKTGQKIVFKAADNPKKLKSFNLGRGYTKYVLFEELDQFSKMAEIRNILQSFFRGEDKHRISFYLYNPPKSSRSWVNKEAKIPKPGRRVHSSTYLDVPPEWLGQRFLVDAEHLKKTNEVAYRHEYLGEEVGTGLEVFTNVTLREITNDEIEKFDRIKQGIDFGYGGAPVVFIKMHFDKTRRRLYFFYEFSGLKISNRKLYTKIKYNLSGMTTADSAEPKSIAELRDYGMAIRGAKKGKDSVKYGIKFLSEEIEELIIDPVRCPRAANEFINYALNEDGDDYPDKDNHVIDAARYALETEMRGGWLV